MSLALDIDTGAVIKDAVCLTLEDGSQVACCLDERGHDKTPAMTFIASGK